MRTELSIILQIILESLPVSSSGNLALFGLTLPTDINYAAHSATLVIYALFFRKKIMVVLLQPLRFYKTIVHAVLYGVLALLPTLFFYCFIEYTQPEFTLWSGFVITSLALFLSALPAGADTGISGYKAFLIGASQGVALLPGISRLGITCAMARWLGFSWRTAFAFSCMIEAPLLLVATSKGFYDLFSAGGCLALWQVLIYGAATLVSYGIFLFVYRMAKNNYWWIFGIYTSVLACLAFKIVS